MYAQYLKTCSSPIEAINPCKPSSAIHGILFFRAIHDSWHKQFPPTLPDVTRLEHFRLKESVDSPPRHKAFLNCCSSGNRGNKGSSASKGAVKPAQGVKYPPYRTFDNKKSLKEFSDGLLTDGSLFFALIPNLPFLWPHFGLDENLCSLHRRILKGL